MGWAHCCVMPPPTDSAAIDPRMLHRDDHINPPRPRGLDVPCARLRATNPLRALARCVQAGKPGTSSGHRSVPHTADLRIEAWAPTRDGCIRQAVLGTVESFLDLESAHAVHTRLRRLTADRDDDLLVAVLEEVIYLLDTVGETPVDLRLRDVDGGVDVTFATTDASTLVQVGAVPKAVSLNELRFSQGRHGWPCAVTLDV